ncbi:MAG TPA: hypothetical protein PLU07_09285 [Ferruginibacter sp.]|nr:hypothetical protein [Ferruginibacter sp.]
MEKSTQDIVSILETAKKKIENLNVSIENSQFKSRAISDISKTISALKIVATPGEAPAGETDTELPKVKTMFGRRFDMSHQPAPPPPPVTDIQEEEMKSRKEQQRNNELDIFIQRIDSIYPEFNNMTNEEIFNSLSDMEIRGVARKAGLSFTETDPKVITTGDIADIREAIEKRAEIDAQVIAAKESLKETDTVQKPAATDTVTTDTSLDAPPVSDIQEGKKEAPNAKKKPGK